MNPDIDQSALAAHLKRMEEAIASAPQHVLEAAQAQQARDAHNAAIDAAKTRKKQLRDIAKQARIPVEAVKRMFGTIRRAG